MRSVKCAGARCFYALLRVKKMWKNCIFGRFSSITADPLVISKPNFNTAEFLTRCSKWDAPMYSMVSQKCGRAVFLCPTQVKKIWKTNCIFGCSLLITADPLVISKRNFNTVDFLTRCSKWDAPRYRTVSQKCECILGCISSITPAPLFVFWPWKALSVAMAYIISFQWINYKCLLK